MCRNDTGAMSVMRPITVVLLAVLLCGGGALVEAARPSHITPPPAPPLPAADAMTSPATSPTTTAQQHGQQHDRDGTHHAHRTRGVPAPRLMS